MENNTAEEMKNLSGTSFDIYFSSHLDRFANS
jgi:hypothetical protein